MTIGLSATQIRKLTPGNGYTDKKIVSMVKTANLHKSRSWWSNGQVLFFEETPEVYDKDISLSERSQIEKSEYIARLAQNCTIPVYPVEIRENDLCDAKVSICFTTGDFDIWANPKYVLSLLKTCRAGRTQAIDWLWNGDKERPTLLARNGHNIGLLMALVTPKGDPEWSFRYTGELS